MRNIELMVQFYRNYPRAFMPSPIPQTPFAELPNSIGQTPLARLSDESLEALPVDKIPWGHNVLLMRRIKDLK